MLDKQTRPELQNVVELVKVALGCPVALVSILDEDRQVFAAHIGLPGEWARRGETPLTHSFCQHVVNANAPLIVGDARLHDLVRDNLAIEDLGVTSYLGVPLTLPNGLVVGALAAIDNAPRGWTAHDVDLMARLGEVASGQIEVFLTEQRWSRLFEQLEEGIVIGSVIRDRDGSVIDWRIETVNPAWSRLIGVEIETISGKTIRTLFPNLGSDWIADVAEVLQTGRNRRFTRWIAAPGRWVEGYIQTMGDNLFVITFLDVTDRMESAAALQDSETKLRLIVEGAKDYIILTLDADQTITSWFGGAQDTFGWAEAEMLGQPFDSIFTNEDRDAGVPAAECRRALVEGVAPDRRWHMTADGSRVFLDGTIRPLPDTAQGRMSGFIKVARNATAQKLSESRQLAFLELGDKIRELDSAPEVAFAAAEIMAHSLAGATRAGYGIVDPIAETVTLLPDWRAAGVDTVAGLHHFRDYGSYIEDLKRGETVIISDVAADSRTAGSAALLQSIGISVLVNVPIMAHGAFVGVMFVHYDKPHEFTVEEQDFVRTVADRTREAISRIRAEEEQQILNHEISHRLKNTMAMVQAIASQTLRPVKERAHVQAFISRLHALSNAHEVLLGRDGSSARIMSVLSSVLGPLSPPARCEISGPDLEVGPRTALALALLMHELGTNALKYGAWANDCGLVAVTWTVEPANDDSALLMTWVERQGPPVSAPLSTGFGSKLIRLGLTGSGGATIDYAPDGLKVEMRALLSQLRQF
nr:GAF domain-containing protein [Rhizobium sp. SSA_523]